MITYKSITTAAEKLFAEDITFRSSAELEAHNTQLQATAILALAVAIKEGADTIAEALRGEDT